MWCAGLRGYRGGCVKGTARKALAAIVAIAAVATVAFAISNSLMPPADSWSASGAVADFLAPVMQRLYGLAQGVAAIAGHPLHLTYGEFVRKLAHVAEYCLLGAECAGITVLLSGRVLSPHLWACLFVPLAVAVSDEYAQLLSGRTSQVSDVLIDFFSALAGIAIVLLIAVLATSRPQRS